MVRQIVQLAPSAALPSLASAARAALSSLAALLAALLTAVLSTILTSLSAALAARTVASATAIAAAAVTVTVVAIAAVAIADAGLDGRGGFAVAAFDHRHCADRQIGYRRALSVYDDLRVGCNRKRPRIVVAIGNRDRAVAAIADAAHVMVAVIAIVFLLLIALLVLLFILLSATTLVLLARRRPAVAATRRRGVGGNINRNRGDGSETRNRQFFQRAGNVSCDFHVFFPVKLFSTNFINVRSCATRRVCRVHQHRRVRRRRVRRRRVRRRRVRRDHRDHRQIRRVRPGRRVHPFRRAAAERLRR